MKSRVLFLAFVAFASALCGAAEVKCKKCNDKGVIYKECETCRGSKYVWKCNAQQPKHYYTSNLPENNTSEYCGYGSTYKPIHQNCKGTRKRLNCPACVKGKSKNFSTGKIAVACPYCDGNGSLAGEYYVIRDASYITDSDREYVFLHMDKPGDQEGSPVSRAKIFKKRMDKDALEEFKTVYANCKVFDTLDEMKTFLKNNARGVGAVGQNPMMYAVRNAERVTQNDRRVVFEELGQGFLSYSGGNIIQRRFSAQDLEDFRLINPKCRVFESLDGIKAFMRTVAVVETGDVYQPVRRVVRRAEPEQSAVTVTPSASSTGRKELTMEELDARIKAEMEHEKEMIQRSLNK